MESRTSSSASLCLKVLPPLPPTSPDIPDIMEGSDTRLPLMEKKLPPTQSTWSADAADLCILLCSFLLSTASIVLIALIFHTQVVQDHQFPHPLSTLSKLQRVITSLCIPVTSAVIMVAGKRYVLLKLTRGGVRSRRFAVYSNPSIENLASYLVLHGAEAPLLSLSAVWGLAMVTSLTVNKSWEMVSISGTMDIAVPVGPSPSNSSLLVPASELLNFVVAAFFLGAPGTFGLINITGTNIATGQPMGIIYYPPLPLGSYTLGGFGFSFSTTMNAFNISMEQLSSAPSTAQNLTCAQSPDTAELWSDGSDNQTLSIVVVDRSHSITRFKATAIVVAEILSSTGDYMEFALNGTSRPNVMPTDSQWAQDITSLICNPIITSVNPSPLGSSLSDFATFLNNIYGGDLHNMVYLSWSTTLSMALGAYSFAIPPPNANDARNVPIVIYDTLFTPQYGIYILILHIIVSFIMLIVVVRLRLASHLGPDFFNSTRLLLDPLKKPGLFNASLNTTVDALADPYMLVNEDSEFVLTGRQSKRERRKRIGRFALRNPFD